MCVLEFRNIQTRWKKNYILICTVFKFRQQTILVIAVPMTVNRNQLFSYHIIVVVDLKVFTLTTTMKLW